MADAVRLQVAINTLRESGLSHEEVAEVVLQAVEEKADEWNRESMQTELGKVGAGMGTKGAVAGVS